MQPGYENSRDAVETVDVFLTGGVVPHFHGSIELLFVISGEIVATVDGKTDTLKAGGFAFADGYVVHAYTKVTPEAVGRVVIIPKSYLSDYDAAHKGKYPAECFSYDEVAFGRSLKIIDLLEDALSDAPPDKRLIKGLVGALLAASSEPLRFEKRDRGQSETMREVLRYISAHYDEEIDLKALSEKFGYSPSYFSRIFHAYVGGTLVNYLGTVRAEKAALRIEAGASVLDAAFDSGFQSMRTFYRSFKKRFGCSPKEFSADEHAIVE